MKNNILDRYDKTDKGEYLIGVKVDSYKNLLNEFDFSSSFWKRDLREEFVEYLIECVDEISVKRTSILKITLPVSEETGNIEKKFDSALKNYFLYLIYLAKKRIKKIITKISFNFIISISLLIVVFLTGQIEGDKNSMLYSIFNEGLYIAIWVLMWPVFSDFLFDLKEALGQIKIYRIISDIEIIHEYF